MQALRHLRVRVLHVLRRKSLLAWLCPRNVNIEVRYIDRM